MNLKEYNQTYNDMKQVIGSARKYQTFVCKEWTRKITDVEGVPIIIKEFGKNYVIDES